MKKLKCKFQNHFVFNHYCVIVMKEIPLSLADRYFCHRITLSNGIDDILSADHLAEDGVLAVEVWLR